MGDENEVPLLLEFLFGDAAETTQHGASARLMRWAEAFEAWLAERALKVTPSSARKSKISWRRLLQNHAEMPWRLTQEDIQAHAAWMEAQEYAPSTISYELGIMENFYRWCDERGVDPECEAGYNPAAGVKRPRVKRFANVQLLSRGEVDALLGILAKDETPLGKRDYAFFLARLRVGVKLQELVQLRWGQLELDAEGARVLWEPGERRARLPGEVWGAIQDYLEASGRLAGIQAEDYIFAPLAQKGVAGSNDREEDWEGGRSLSGRQMRRNLKLYGRLVGIAEEKLNLPTLLFTAIRLRLDQGASRAELKDFVQSRDAKFRLSRIKMLPGLPGNEERVEIDAEAPDRRGKPFPPGYGLTHGFRARRLPEEEVQAVLDEDVQGLDEEIAGLRELVHGPAGGATGRGLEAWMKEALNLSQEMKLLDMHTLALFQLAELRDTAEQLAQVEEVNPWVEDFMKGMDCMGVEKGDPEFGEKVRAEVYGSKTELTAREREIASTRASLRRVLKLARTADQVSDYMHLVEIYGRGCGRLKRTLKKEAGAASRAERYVMETIRLVHADESKEWERIR